MLPALSALSLHCRGAEIVGCQSDGKRPCRRDRRGRPGDSAQPPPPALPAVAIDSDGRTVYVDLQPRDTEEAFVARLGALRERLVAVQPSARILERLTPINRGRLLVEIEDEAALSRFAAWLKLAIEYRSASLGPLLAPLGRRLRLLGAQFIVPRATEYEPFVPSQTPHTDVDAMGEVISVALSVHGHELNTLIDATARLTADGRVTGGGGFARAATSIFAYDTGAVHAGPGIPRVEPPFPRFFTDRVFCLLCSTDLEPTRIAQHRRANGLLGRADLTIDLGAEQ